MTSQDVWSVLHGQMGRDDLMLPPTGSRGDDAVSDRGRPSTWSESRLLGRRKECAALDRLLLDVSAGSSRILVLRGEAGVGKSALLAHVAAQASGWRVTRVEGVESDTESAYSGLQRLCAPLMENLRKLPAPQQKALAAAFGLGAHPAPAAFLVGLATLTLLAEAADHQPLLCVVDDAQWLDSATEQVLEFVARRLIAERVAFVCAARTEQEEQAFKDLPALHLGGLDGATARALLLAHVRGPLDPAVVDRIVAESHGNPLALLELPRTWNVSELAGGYGVLDSRPVTTKIEQSFSARLRALPAETQLLVLVAAAEPVGNPALLRRAATILGLDMAALTPAADDGLVQIRGRVEFAHPLVRSVAYRAGAVEQRRRVHQALARASDPRIDPDRRAWHWARATTQPDEEVAAELARCAGRAQARGGLAAAAAFLDRAAALTSDPVRRVERALTAADAGFHAGLLDQASRLLAVVDNAPLEARQRARLTLLRAHVTFARGLGADAPPLLMEAARGFEPLDPGLARETYLKAWAAAVFGGRRTRGSDLLDVSRAIRALPPLPLDTDSPLHLLLDGLAALVTEVRADSAPRLQRAVEALTDLPLQDVLSWGWMATAASNAVWDCEATRLIAAHHVELLLAAGALTHLQLPLAALAEAHVWRGEFADARSVLAEAADLAAMTGVETAPYMALRLSALEGEDADALAPVTRDTGDDVSPGGPLAAVYAFWASSILCNGLGRHREAMTAASNATDDPIEPFVSVWALPELVEAAMRAGERDRAREGCARLVETTQPCRTDFARGMEARSRALVEEGQGAESLYREAVERFGSGRLRPDLGRAHLLYGEWLRRHHRRDDARRQLQLAYDVFSTLGMAGFGRRARQELAAMGEQVSHGTALERQELSVQEDQVARLARDGLTNREIAARLFLSVKTVEWHLRKVFTKLGISSRRDLRRALTEHDRPAGGR